MTVNSRLSDSELLDAIYRAAYEYSKLIGKNIDEFMKRKYKIVLVLQKSKSQEKYGMVTAEIKGGTFKRYA